jgi:CDP-diacylglycerol--serine O-phosphatidyltransferase
MQEGRIQLGPATIATNVFPQDKTVIMKFLTNPFILVIITLVFSWLLISPIKLMAFKFKGFGWKPNQWKYILLILSLPLVIFLGFASAPIILLLYIIISQIHFRKQAHEI